MLDANGYWALWQVNDTAWQENDGYWCNGVWVQPSWTPGGHPGGTSAPVTPFINPQSNPHFITRQYPMQCVSCNGAGEIQWSNFKSTCKGCDGTGKVFVTETTTV